MAAPRFAGVFLYQLNQAGMLERLVDLFFTLEALGKNRVGFDFGIGDNESDSPVCEHIGGPKRGGGAALGDHTLNTVVVQLVAYAYRHPLRIVHLFHPYSSVHASPSD